MKIAIAGASGILGQQLIKAFYDQGFQVIALVRNEDKISHLRDKIEEVRQVQVTQPETLKNCLKGCDGIVSTVGITRQRDPVGYEDVDYQGNINLLVEAKKAGLKKFIYVSVVNVDKDDTIAGLAAKHKFEKELQKSGMPYLIVRPTGFFTDLLEVFRMARKGTIYAFGDPQVSFTPIHPQDLAEIIAEKYKEEGIIEVGGPEHLSYYELAKICGRVLNKPIKIRQLSNWMLNSISFVLKRTHKRFYSLWCFVRLQAKLGDYAQSMGKKRIEDFLREHVQS